MADDNSFGGGLQAFGNAVGNLFSGGASAPPAAPGGDNGTDVLPTAAQSTEGRTPSGGFGSGIGSFGPPSYESKPGADPLDAAANMLQQRIDRAQQVGSNPLLQIMNPEGAMAARNFVPQATEQLLKIKQQKATISANRQEASNLGLAPGEVADEATQAERVTVAKDRALQGNLTVFKGLQAVDPKAAEAIAPQVMEVVGGHLTKAQYAYDKLSNMRNQGEYDAALSSLRKEGALSDLEALGLKVPGDYGTFTKAKATEGQALREARMSVNDLRTKLEERNTYQPMEKKEAETYNGRLTTAFGDQVTNGSWARRGSDGKRALVVNGMDDPRNLGKSFTLATPDQRKAIADEFKGAVPVADIEKDRAFNRIYKIATTDKDGKPLPANQINTNPNVQQGVAEGLAAALRGGNGGANTGLLNIETSKRGVVQGVLDSITSGYAGAINTISEKDVRPYLTKLTQSQIRDVMDAIHTANSNLLNDRVGSIAERAGALGLDVTAFGLGKDEANGAIGAALERGRAAQVQRMMPYHQAIGGGDGALAIGAQAVGQDATPLPPGATPRTQQPVATNPQRTLPPGQPASPPSPPVPGGGGTPPGGNPASVIPGNGPAPSSPGGGAPVQVAGQQINVPLPQGASPNYVASLQRIESGKERDPWTSGAKGSSASGAFQFINSTWRDNKPAGAPPRAADATPAQQAEALANLTTKNAAALSRVGVPVDDTNLYIAHNVGAGGAASLLRADPNADARSVVGEDAARNNPLFFKGKPSVAIVLGRYQAEMAKDIDVTVPRGTPPLPGAAKPAGDQPSLMTRISRTLMQGVPENERDAAVARVGDAATDNAPAIGSTIGALGGSVGGPAGAVAGGGAGGAAGQAVKDWLQGRDQSPRAIAKEGALGAVLGVGGAARPLLGAAARTVGAAAVEGGDAALQGKEGADVADAAVHGATTGAVGEAFGRALGMAGHKLWSMFAPDAQKAVQAAASKYADAEKVLASEVPKLPGPGGTGAVSNPKYEAAEKAKAEAETVLKDVGIKPEEAAYAHKVASEGVPKQEAQVSKPGALEKDDIGKGYGQLENEVADAGKGALKETAKPLQDGPITAVISGKVSERHTELAQRVENAITAPAPDWRTKWTQLKDARSDLLQAERDALSSTAPGRTQIAKDMRELADTVRVQQEKAAKYVFGEKDGTEFMKRLKVLDTRYRNLMDATNGGDIAKAAALKGEAGREAEKKFVAFAHDDKDAIAAYRAMRGVKGDLAEATVPWTVAAEGLPVIGKGVKVVKLGGILREWARERAAGSPATFADIVRMQNTGESARMARDVAGTAVQRGAVMQDQQQQ